MIRSIFYTPLLSVFMSLALSSLAYAGELRVLDQKGLTRASKPVSGGGDVIVRFGPAVQPDSIHLSLTPVDVIGRDLEGALGQGEIRFSSVKEGTWQLKGSPEGAKILSVVISAGARQ